MLFVNLEKNRIFFQFSTTRGRKSIKQLPAIGKRKYNEVVALINKVNKLKW